MKKIKLPRSIIVSRISQKTFYKQKIITVNLMKKCILLFMKSLSVFVYPEQ